MRRINILLGVLLLLFSCNKDGLQMVTYTVKFKVLGTNSTEEIVVHGNTIQRDDPINDDQVFAGWFKQGYNQKVDKRTPITEDMTLVARFMGTITIGDQVWLDRNLGATRVALNVTDTRIETCGNYYQWGRGNDGHEIYNSTTSTKQITWNNRSNNRFITANSSTWIDGGNPVGKTYNTMNNPCPDGFRVPKSADFQSLDTTIGVSHNYHEAYFNVLKMVRCGVRGHVNYYSSGSFGAYWSADRKSIRNAYMLYFTSTNSYPNPSDQEVLSNDASHGYSVRCIKEKRPFL